MWACRNIGLTSFWMVCGSSVPTRSLPGPRVIAVEDADVGQVLDNDMKCR